MGYFTDGYKQGEAIQFGKSSPDEHEKILKDILKNGKYSEIVEWYKTIEDDDTFLYLNASKNMEKFYQKFGFRARPNEDVGAGMKWYRD